MVSLTDIHAYLHFKACQDHEVISTSSFACFFHPTSADEESNYALPEVCEGGDLQTNLRELLSLFGERVRTPTLQFIEELFPYLLSFSVSPFILFPIPLFSYCSFHNADTNSVSMYAVPSLTLPLANFITQQ